MADRLVDGILLARVDPIFVKNVLNPFATDFLSVITELFTINLEETVLLFFLLIGILGSMTKMWFMSSRDSYTAIWNLGNLFAIKIPYIFMYSTNSFAYSKVLYSRYNSLYIYMQNYSQNIQLIGSVWNDIFLVNQWEEKEWGHMLFLESFLDQRSRQDSHYWS